MTDTTDKHEGDSLSTSVWMGSIRVRLSLLYSLLVFGLAALLVAGVYIGVSRSLSNQDITTRVAFIQETEGQWIQSIGSDGRRMLQFVPGERRRVEQDAINPVLAIEREANREALEQFRRFSFVALAGLFAASLVIGWFVADRALSPIARICRVARDISGSDLSRRIALGGHHDELREMADTFDDMLDRLDRAFESQRAFIHEASHELRNPIAVIRTNADVALAAVEPDPDDLRSTVEVISRSAERMGVLVDDLLTYARREAPSTREDVVDLADVVGTTVAAFTVPAETRDLTLRSAAEPGLLVSGDKVALEQALTNLVANAVRLAPAGSSIRVAAAAEDGQVWMAVEDEGPGIDSADQDRIFERFVRGEGQGGRSDGRSGLGLTIVRQIARGHGGDVSLVSEPGRGSTFSVWLPAMDET